MSLDELYREVILDHYRSPRNRGAIEGADLDVHMLNPLCGDEVRITADLEDGVIRDVRFVGKGCSISMASASMMTEAIKGRTVEEAKALIRAFKAMMRGEPGGGDLGDLAALQGVARFPVRIKCATLAWNTLQKGLEGDEPED
jgi:nitrogen fixation NifU-like protein